MGKAVFGLIGLVVVLAIVAVLAKSQLSSVGKIDAKARAGVAEATGASVPQSVSPAGTAGEQIKGMEQSVRDRTNDALNQGAQRAQDETR